MIEVKKYSKNNYQNKMQAEEKDNNHKKLEYLSHLFWSSLITFFEVI
jgi:hypothetical protein